MKSKIVSLGKARRTAERLRRSGQKIVFTNGAFDILHAGHVRYLQKARSLGDVLFVGVNSDDSVRGYKGPDRPINPQADRLEVMAALGCVDYVVCFPEPTPIRLIQAVRPHVLVKGADWSKKNMVGAREVESWGGRVRRVSLVRGRSTTGVIERIKGLLKRGRAGSGA